MRPVPSVMNDVGQQRAAADFGSDERACEFDAGPDREPLRPLGW
jgi:hypothetical protein